MSWARYRISVASSIWLIAALLSSGAICTPGRPCANIAGCMAYCGGGGGSPGSPGARPRPACRGCFAGRPRPTPFGERLRRPALAAAYSRSVSLICLASPPDG